MELIASKYGVSKTFDLPLIEYGATDYVTGVTLAAGDVKISKDGGAFVNIATLPTILGAWMEITLSATEMEAGRVKVQVIDQTATKVFEDNGATLNTDIIDLILDEPCTGATHNVKFSLGRRIRSIGNALGFSVVADGANTALTFKTDLPSAKDNFYNDQVIHGIDNENEDATRIVESYDGTTKFITLDEALTDVPAAGDTFELVPTHIHPISQIVDAIINDPAAGLAVLKALGLTRLASSVYGSSAVPSGASVVNGTVISGSYIDLASINQVYWKIQETGKFKLTIPFAGLSSIESEINAIYRYFGPGSTNHKIKARMWNYNISAMVDITSDDHDFPSTEQDSLVRFSVPGDPSDYFTGVSPNIAAILEIEHISNANIDHEFWMEFVTLGELERIYVPADNAGITAIDEAVESTTYGLAALQALIAVLPTNPVNVISAISGSIQVPTVKDGGTLEVYYKTTISIPVDLEKDMTGKKIFFTLRESVDDAAYTIPDGGTNAKDITSAFTLATGAGTLDLTASELTIDAKKYEHAEIFSEPSAGGDPTPEQIFKLHVKRHAGEL